MENELLKFGEGNAKLSEDTLTFSLPAGHTCPGAHKCLAKVNPDEGTITDGKYQVFRCFAASMEVRPNVRESRWHNHTLLSAARTKDKMVDLIKRSLAAQKAGWKRVRIHVSGDFFSQTYFDAWMEVAASIPDKTFYAYTKSIPFWAARFADISSNFVLTASLGGKHDNIVDRLNLRTVKVVMSTKEAHDEHLELDHDDSHAYNPEVRRFGLLIHGVQKAGSPAAMAVSSLKSEGFTGYVKK